MTARDMAGAGGTSLCRPASSKKSALKPQDILFDRGGIG